MNRNQWAGFIWIGAVSVVLAGTVARAATNYWGGGKVDIANGTAISSNAVTLSGVWDKTIKNWAASADGATYGAWQDGNYAFLTSFTNDTAFQEVITQTVDVAVSGITADSSKTPDKTYTAVQQITATNSRTLTLSGPSPIFDVKVREANAYLAIMSNVKLVGTNGLVKKGGTSTGRLRIYSDCSGLTGTVTLLEGPAAASWGNLILENTANMRNVANFDCQGGALVLTPVAGMNQQVHSNAVVRISGNYASLAAFSQFTGGLSFGAGLSSAATQIISQVNVDSFGWLSAGSATTVKPTLILSHATAGIDRGARGKGTLHLHPDSSYGSLKADIVVENGLATGVTIPWIAMDDARPVRLNASKILEVVPITVATNDLSLWVNGQDYVITNASFVSVNSIPNGRVINTLGVNGPTTSFTLQIGSGATDALTIGAGLVSMLARGGTMTITNGYLLSGTNELNFITSYNGGSGSLYVYSAITGNCSVSVAGSALVRFYATNNAYTGGTYVNSGLLESYCVNGIPGDLFIEPGACFAMGADECINSNANVVVRGGRLSTSNTRQQTFNKTVTFIGGWMDLGGYGNGISFTGPGAALVFQEGACITQTYAGMNMSLKILTDVQYASAASNQALFASCNTKSNLLQFLDLTSGSSATRTWDVSNSVTLASSIPEVDIDMPLQTASGYPATFVKAGDGALELTGITGVFAGSGVVSNGTLNMNYFAPATNLACTMSSGSAVVTGLASTNGLLIGQLLATNAAMSTRRYIRSIDSASQITLNNTASGTTNVIQLLACSALGTGSVTVAGGTLAGRGGVGGSVTVKSGGTLAPGTSTNAASTFRIGGNLTVESGGILAIDLPAGTNDAVAVAGSVSISGGTLAVTGAKPAVGETLSILTSTNLTATFTSVTDGFSVKTSGTTLQLARRAAGFVFSAQ